MRALKLPPFNEDKDDLDAYLIRFERAFEVRQEHRSTQLARLLQGCSRTSCTAFRWLRQVMSLEKFPHQNGGGLFTLDGENSLFVCL